MPQKYLALRANGNVRSRRFHLDNKRHRTVNKVKHLSKSRNAVFRIKQFQFFQFIDVQVIDVFVHAAHSYQRTVMHNNGYAVL